MTADEYTAHVARMPLHVLKDEVRAHGLLLADLGEDIDPSDVLFREIARDELRARS